MSPAQTGFAYEYSPPHGTGRRWLPYFVPQQGLLLGTFFVILAVIVSAWFSTQTPWLGIHLSPGTTQGATVARVAPFGPSVGVLQPGDIIVAVLGPGGEEIPLNASVFVNDPDAFSTFSDYNRYFEEHAEISDALKLSEATFVLSNRDRVNIQPMVSRPLSDLPMAYWLTVVCGSGGFLVGLGVWVFRRGEIAPRLLLLGGIGLLFNALAASVYGGRELTLDTELFLYASGISRFGITLLAVSVWLLQFYYPERLLRFPFAQVIYAIFAFVLLNEYFQWVEPPIHAFKLQFTLIYLAALIPAVWQWRRTRGRPAARAALQWFLIAIFGCSGIALGAYTIPHTLGYEPIISVTFAFVIGLVMFIGLALGVLRYRLFDLERWWFEVWVWFFGVLLVIAADAFLAYSLGFAPETALGVGLVLIGWVYFPGRQWLWGLFTRGRNKGLEHYVPLMLQAFFSSSSALDLPRKWHSLLRTVFQPSDIKVVVASGLKEPELRDDGLVLEVPDLAPNARLVLRYAGQGRRLFSTADQRLAQGMFSLANRALVLRDEQERGVNQERERIMRDLHDDVAARLLTLIHRADTAGNAQTARSALESLRETIYSLDDTASVFLSDLLLDISIELRERLEAQGVGLAWEQDNPLPPGTLNARQCINLKRIVREAVSGAIRHGQAGNIFMQIRVDDSMLLLSVCDDGRGESPADWAPGKGISNIRTRAEELGGRAEWRGGKSGRGCCVEVHIPLEIPATNTAKPV